VRSFLGTLRRSTPPHRAVTVTGGGGSHRAARAGLSAVGCATVVRQVRATVRMHRSAANECVAYGSGGNRLTWLSVGAG
jgi:hypothetical protein